MIRKTTLITLIFLLSACASTQEPKLANATQTFVPPTATIKPTNTQTSTPTITPAPTVTNTPTPTPTPIGGSSKPILAMSMGNGNGDSFILITELFSEREIARIPINMPGEALNISPTGDYLAFIDTRDGQRGIYSYHLLTQEITFLYSQPEETGISKIRWSPDQKWLAIEMDVFARRSTELWVLDSSNGYGLFLSSGYTIEWLNASEVFYQNSGGGLKSYNMYTGATETLNYRNYTFSNMEILIGDDISAYSGQYLPHFSTSYATTRNTKVSDNPINYILRRDINDGLGLHLGSYKTETDMRLIDLLLAPDAETWVLCRIEGSGARSGDSHGFSGGQYFTSWAKEIDLPMTTEMFIATNFQPLLFAPDGNTLLGLRHNPMTTYENPLRITGIKIFDMESFEEVYYYKFPKNDDLSPYIRLSSDKPKSFDLIWNENQVDLSLINQTHISTTPTVAP